MSSLKSRVKILEKKVARRSKVQYILLDVVGGVIVNRTSGEEYSLERLFDLAQKNPDVVFVPLVQEPGLEHRVPQKAVSAADLRLETEGGPGAFEEEVPISGDELARALEPWAFYDEMSRRMLRSLPRIRGEGTSHGLAWPVELSCDVPDPPTESDLS